MAGLVGQKKPLKLKGFSLCEVWWRRRESNPRPRTFRQNIYIHSLYFEFAPKASHRQDSRETILLGFAPLL